LALCRQTDRQTDTLIDNKGHLELSRAREPINFQSIEYFFLLFVSFVCCWQIIDSIRNVKTISNLSVVHYFLMEKLVSMLYCTML